VHRSRCALRRGRWYGQQLEALIRDGIGLLVLDGLLLRRVGVDGRYGAEVLGDGDLLRPWQGEDAQPTLPLTTGWQVLQPARVAVLDRRVARRLARYPDLTGGLVGRALQRSRHLAVNIAIVHQARVDVRLSMLLWHLADRWGTVTPQGIVLPLELNHTMLEPRDARPSAPHYPSSPLADSLPELLAAGCSTASRRWNCSSFATLPSPPTGRELTGPRRSVSSRSGRDDGIPAVGISVGSQRWSEPAHLGLDHRLVATLTRAPIGRASRRPRAELGIACYWLF
jgi:hypothetical protein